MEGLSRQQERKLLAAFHPQSFAPREVIVREGEPADALYLIEEGSVSVFMSDCGAEVATSAETEATRAIGDCAEPGEAEHGHTELGGRHGR